MLGTFSCSFKYFRIQSAWDGWHRSRVSSSECPLILRVISVVSSWILADESTEGLQSSQAVDTMPTAPPSMIILNRMLQLTFVKEQFSMSPQQIVMNLQLPKIVDFFKPYKILKLLRKNTSIHIQTSPSRKLLWKLIPRQIQAQPIERSLKTSRFLCSTNRI